MAIILTDVLVGEGLASVEQVRAAMAACGKDESRLPSVLASKGVLHGEKLEILYALAACRASEDAEGAGAAKARLRRPPPPPPPPTAPPPELAAALQDRTNAFGPFTLLQEIGQGARSVVHRAWRTDPGRLVAVKMLPTGTPSPDVQRVGKLLHSAIVRPHDSGVIDGRPYLSMDLVQGRTLDDQLQKGAVPWKTAVQVVADIALALQFAHDLGVMHRNLRPSNILVDPSGAGFVLDLGLARNPDDPFPDTPLYMSPEQLEGREIDARSEVYSLGAVLHHAVSGAPPFEVAPFGKFFDTVRAARPDPASKRALGIPSDLDQIILRCLEKKPGDRYGRAFDLAVDLKRVLRGLRPLTAPSGPAPRRKSPEIDESTGLRSRRSVLREPEGSSPSAVVLFDVDQFYAVNEREGRDRADLRLRKIAGLLKDGVACRHGGDSFLCVLPGVDKTGAVAFGEKIRAMVPQTLPGLTISAGVAAAPEDGTGLQALLRAAQAALLQAKTSGRDRIVAARGADLPRPILGRDAELSAAGAAAVVTVEGDPGSGKTRFLTELAARAASKGVLPILLSGDEAKSPLPGGLLLSLVHEYFAGRAPSREALRAKLTQPQRFVLRDAAPCFRGWTPDLPAPLPSEYQSHLQPALAAALRTMASETPVLLLVDHASAADALSLTVLRDVVRDGSLPLGIAFATKGSSTSLGISASTVRLTPLADEHVESMVRKSLEGTPYPEAFPHKVAEAARGNPLYVVAALRGLPARGKMTDLPSSLDHALGRLVEGCPKILAYASVMGPVIDVDALQALGIWREPEILDMLDALEDRGLVQSGRGGRIEFASESLRDSALRSIPPPQLQELRAQLSNVLMDLYGFALPESSAPVAAPAPTPVGPPPPPLPTPLSEAAMEAAIRFIQALTTEVKMGRLYARESRMRVELRDRLTEAAREMMAAAPFVVFTLGAQGVKVNDAPLPGSGEGAGRSLTQLLQEKLVEALKIDRGITNPELYQLLDAFSPALSRDTTPPDYWERMLDIRRLSHIHIVQSGGGAAPATEAPPALSRAPSREARPKGPDIAETAQAMLALPMDKFLATETLSAVIHGLMDARLPRPAEQLIDRLVAGLKETADGLRRQTAAALTRTLDLAAPAVRDLVLRRLEAPLVAEVATEQDPLTVGLLGNLVRSWMVASAMTKQQKMMVAFSARVASNPDTLKRLPAVRAAIGSTLGSMGSTATEEVTDLLSKGDPSLREGAARLAAMIGAAMVHPLISLILTHGDITVRRLAGSALKEIGDGVRQLAQQVKADAPANVVRNVLSVYELVGPGGGDVASVLRVAAAHADPSVREAAGALLVRAKALFTPILLSELLARTDDVLHKSAIMAARDLKMREAGAGVLKIAETTADEETLRAACNYFRECPMSEALPLLTRLFESKARAFGLFKGMSDATRVAATEALRRLSSPDAKRLIDRALNDGSETVRRAAKP